MKAADYNLFYTRNIGLFTPEQQSLIRDMKVFVAGCGGAGGVQAATLARFGVGELRLMDPGVFDEPDFNRQFGATVPSLGENKAAATAALLRDINPFMKITVYSEAIASEMELEEAMRGCDLVIDAIDYIGFDYKIKFAQAARRLGLYNYTSPLPGFGALLVIFDPQGMTLEEFYDSPADVPTQKTYMIPPQRFFGHRPAPPTWLDFTMGRQSYISTNSGSASLSGALLATEAVLWRTGLRPTAELAVAPQVTLMDLLSRETLVYNPLAELR